jgi:hypothetical protein
MANKKEQLDPIPEQFGSIEAAAEFWDTHDLSDYETQTTEVDFTVNSLRHWHLVAIDPELAIRIAHEARQCGISAETLVNLWLSERLMPNTS